MPELYGGKKRSPARGRTASVADKNSPPPEEERTIWTALRSMGHLMERLRDRELAPHGLTVQQSGILSHVNALGDAATPSALSRQMLREPTTVSALLNRMERQGLVKKARHPGKKNQVLIRLTPKGKRMLAVSLERKSAARVMSRLSPEARARLLEGILEFRKSLLQELAESQRDRYFEGHQQADSLD